MKEILKIKNEKDIYRSLLRILEIEQILILLNLIYFLDLSTNACC